MPSDKLFVLLFFNMGCCQRHCKFNWQIRENLKVYILLGEDFDRALRGFIMLNEVLNQRFFQTVS